jgi:hypothetical protein
MHSTVNPDIIRSYGASLGESGVSVASDDAGAVAEQREPLSNRIGQVLIAVEERHPVRAADGARQSAGDSGAAAEIEVRPAGL